VARRNHRHHPARALLVIVFNAAVVFVIVVVVVAVAVVVASNDRGLVVDGVGFIIALVGRRRMDFDPRDHDRRLAALLQRLRLRAAELIGDDPQRAAVGLRFLVAVAVAATSTAGAIRAHAHERVVLQSRPSAAADFHRCLSSFVTAWWGGLVGLLHFPFLFFFFFLGGSACGGGDGGAPRRRHRNLVVQAAGGVAATHVVGLVLSAPGSAPAFRASSRAAALGGAGAGAARASRSSPVAPTAATASASASIRSLPAAHSITAVIVLVVLPALPLLVVLRLDLPIRLVIIVLLLFIVVFIDVVVLVLRLFFFALRRSLLFSLLFLLLLFLVVHRLSSSLPLVLRLFLDGGGWLGSSLDRLLRGLGHPLLLLRLLPLFVVYHGRVIAIVDLARVFVPLSALARVRQRWLLRDLSLVSHRLYMCAFCLAHAHAPPHHIGTHLEVFVAVQFGLAHDQLARPQLGGRGLATGPRALGRPRLLRPLLLLPRVGGRVAARR
jgi:hypothetical protein